MNETILNLLLNGYSIHFAPMVDSDGVVVNILHNEKANGFSYGAFDPHTALCQAIDKMSRAEQQRAGIVSVEM